MKRRILLADDSVTIQKVIELTFMDEDFEVRAVSNGDEALALLPEVKPDFVIADVHMPGANGYEVCRKSKQLRISVPVLLLVGTFEPFDENEARAAGADSFLKKPFDSQELLQRVQELLAPMEQAAAAAAPPPMPPLPMMSERASLPTLDFPPPAPPAAPVFPPEPVFSPPPVFPPEPVLPPEPVFSPEPSWGSFDLDGPSPASTAVPPPPVAPPEPFDHEPSFALEPDPSYHVEEEPVFELDESPAPYVPSNVFSAPSELSLEEPLDPYMPEEPVFAPPPAVAGFDWSAAPAELPLTSQAPPAAQAWTPPAEFEPQTWEAAPEPEPEPQQAWSLPEPPAAPAPAPAAPAVSPAEAFPAAVAAVAAPAAVAEATGAGNGHLSDGDIDRIARRLVELLSDKTVRDVAWEVIPDMAEVIIRDRLRELESQAE
jgi:CheY-like chemotaxis protein